MYTIYKFEKDGDKYRKTEQAKFYYLPIERILGKTTIRNKAYEIVYLKNKYFCLDGEFLIDRKYLTFNLVKGFICGYHNGARSMQNHPYTKDLFDNELLDELNIEVLTHKYYYSGDDRLVDVYYVVKKDEVNNELIEELNEISKEQIEKANSYRKSREPDKNAIVWKRCK